ncbi:MAG: hypothetical protein LUD84_06405 [Clostridiales bacterium]|nr:hypothetical protein [Clostridiales bacterium]
MADKMLEYAPEQLERVETLSAQVAERPKETIALAQALFEVFNAGKLLGMNLAAAEKEGKSA